MRIARATVPDLVHHVILRFVDRNWVLRDDEEREAYLRLLARAMTTSDWRCLAYALMSSHIHLAMVAGLAPPERWMRRVHPRFATWINERHGGLGSVIANRCDMFAVRTADVGDLIAYIHNNPVRAGVVARAAESTWTSHRAYTGLVSPPEWLRVDEGLALAGVRADGLDAWVEHRNAAPDVPNLDGIHKETRKRGAIEVGTLTLGIPVEAQLLVRPSTYLRPPVDLVLDTVCAVVGVSREALLSRARRGTALRAIAIQAGRALGLSIASIAVGVGMRTQSGSNLAIYRLDDVDAARLLMIVRRLLDRQLRLTEKTEKPKASPPKSSDLLASRFR